MSTETHTLQAPSRRRVRAKTISIKRLSKRDLERGRRENPPAQQALPRTRGECKQGANVMRPCPFVSCKHHLYLDVDQTSGAIKINYPQLEVWQLPETCALDVADRDGATLEEIGLCMNLVRDGVRRIETEALAKLKGLSLIAASAEEGREVFRTTKLAARVVPRGLEKRVRAPVPSEILWAIEALLKAHGLRSAAEILGISRSTLIRTMKGVGVSARVLRGFQTNPILRQALKRAA